MLSTYHYSAPWRDLVQTLPLLLHIMVIMFHKNLLHASHWLNFNAFVSVSYLFFAAIPRPQRSAHVFSQRVGANNLARHEIMLIYYSKTWDFFMRVVRVIVKYDKAKHSLKFWPHATHNRALSSTLARSSVNHIKNLINVFVLEVKRIWLIYYST